MVHWPIAPRDPVKQELAPESQLQGEVVAPAESAAVDRLKILHDQWTGVGYDVDFVRLYVHSVHLP